MVQLRLVVLGNLVLYALYQVLGFELFNFCHLHSLSIFIVITSNNKLCMHGQFLRTEAEGLFGHFEGNAFNFEEYAARSNGSYPTGRVTFTFTHTHVGRLAGNRFVGENTNPNLSFTVHVAVDGHTGSLNLAAVNPLGVKCLDAERTESQLCTSVGVAFVATTILRSSIFYSFWL